MRDSWKHTSPLARRSSGGATIGRQRSTSTIVRARRTRRRGRTSLASFLSRGSDSSLSRCSTDIGQVNAAHSKYPRHIHICIFTFSYGHLPLLLRQAQDTCISKHSWACFKMTHHAGDAMAVDRCWIGSSSAAEESLLGRIQISSATSSRKTFSCRELSISSGKHQLFSPLVTTCGKFFGGDPLRYGPWMHFVDWLHPEAVRPIAWQKRFLRARTSLMSIGVSENNATRR
jgi:hypothetical protein